ncbi:hypothetical protein JCM11641_005830 [Rhodosporidiobolus odoratus]
MSACDRTLSTPAVVGFTVAAVVAVEAVAFGLVYVAFVLRGRLRKNRKAAALEQKPAAGESAVIVAEPRPQNSLLEKWINREAAAAYTPVRLSQVDEDVPLRATSYPSRPAEPQRQPTTTARPISYAPPLQSPEQPPAPPFQPAPDLAFYAPGLAAALAQRPPRHTTSVPYDPPLPSLSRRPSLSPLRIPTSSPPVSRNPSRGRPTKPKSPAPSIMRKAQPHQQPLQPQQQPEHRDFQRYPPPPRPSRQSKQPQQQQQQNVLKKPQLPTPPPFLRPSEPLRSVTSYPSPPSLPVALPFTPPDSQPVLLPHRDHPAPHGPSRQATLLTSQEAMQRALREARSERGEMTPDDLKTVEILPVPETRWVEVL